MDKCKPEKLTNWCAQKHQSFPVGSPKGSNSCVAEGPSQKIRVGWNLMKPLGSVHVKIQCMASWTHLWCLLDPHGYQSTVVRWFFLHLLFASESAWWCWKFLLFHNSNTSNVWQTGFLSTSPAVLPATFPYGSPTDTSQHSHPTLNPEFLMQHSNKNRGWILTFVTQITKVILLGQKSTIFSLKDLEL
jgi:hypothetical protein